jgi:hypothetical protein
LLRKGIQSHFSHFLLARFFNHFFVAAAKNTNLSSQNVPTTACTKQKNYSLKEDEHLDCNTWLNISQDPIIIGINQTGDSFWNQIAELITELLMSFEQQRVLRADGVFFKE